MRARSGMGFVGETWRLYHQQELLGQLVVTDADFPWLRARFQAEPSFETVRPLFTMTSMHGKRPMAGYGTR
jgi:hypothetical protein